MTQATEQLATTQGTLLAIGGILSACQAQLKQLQDQLKGLTVPVSENETPAAATPETGANEAAPAEKKADATAQKASGKEAASAPQSEELTESDVVSALVKLTKQGIREKGLALLASLDPPAATVGNIPKEKYAYVIKEAKRIGDEHEAGAK